MPATIIIMNMNMKNSMARTGPIQIGEVIGSKNAIAHSIVLFLVHPTLSVLFLVLLPPFLNLGVVEVFGSH